MLSVEDWAEIRRLHRAEGLPIKVIARVLGISKNTVKATLASDQAPKYERRQVSSHSDVPVELVCQLNRLQERSIGVWRQLWVTATAGRADTPRWPLPVGIKMGTKAIPAVGTVDGI
jgi:Sigma-70, region 4